VHAHGALPPVGFPLLASLPQLDQQTYMSPSPMYGILFWTLNLWRGKHYIPLRCCKTLS